MTLDNHISSAFDSFPLKQAATADGADTISELEWDESEAQFIASEITGRRNENY